MNALTLVPLRVALSLAAAAMVTMTFAATVLAAPETICGRVDAVSATDATVDGRAVPLAGLDAQAVGALQLAFNGNLDACVDVDSTGATVNEAFAVQVSFDQCGHVRPGGGTDVMVDGVIIPPVLLDAETYDAIQLARSINGSACLAIEVSGSGGVSSVDAELNMEVCTTVTHVGPAFVELSGTRFAIGNGVDLDDPQPGHVICLVVSSAAGGGVEIIARTDDHDEDDGGTNGGGDVPDTATSSASAWSLPAGVLVLAFAVGLAWRRQSSRRALEG